MIFIPIALGLLLIWFIISRSSRYRGFSGEMQVRRLISHTLPGERYVLNDVIFGSGERTIQIDHILINKYGVFIIETKNLSGRIYGTHDSKNWTQVLSYGRIKHSFYSPVLQNRAHLNVISRLLPKGTPVFSAVVFVKADISNVNSPNVYDLNGLSQFINYGHIHALSREEMEEAYSIIKQEISDVSRRRHIKNVRKRKKEGYSVCPLCHGRLILRHGQSGEFYGCQNYPRCKFTQNK